jgi:3-oxoacyl-[acyl-carrier protein] reductase
VVNVSSIAAKGNKSNVPYSAVKAGIEIMTKGIAKEVGEYNINVNCVAPGTVRTPMVDGALKDVGKDSDISIDAMLDAVVRQQQFLKHGIVMDDISNSVLFLCSEEARNITGHTIYVDGGLKNLDIE